MTEIQKYKSYLGLKIKIYSRILDDVGISSLFLVFAIPLYLYLLANIAQDERGLYGLLLLHVLTAYLLTNRKDSDIVRLYFKNRYLLYGIENLIIGLPYLVVGLIYQSYMYVLPFLSIVIFFTFFGVSSKMSILNKINLSFLMPDYEWVRGVRKHFLVLLIVPVVIIIGIYVENYNISIFGLAFLLMIKSNYYTIVESPEWIWNHRMSAKEFINSKIILLTKKIVLIVILPLGIVFYLTQDIEILTTVTIASAMYFINSILVKYAFYGSHGVVMIYSLTTFLIAVLGIINPLLLLVSFGYFLYLKSKAIITTESLFHIENNSIK